MTRICSYCTKEIGEKCGKCGYEPVTIIDGIGTCYVCEHFWIKGTDGETHGICVPMCSEAKAAIEGNQYDAIAQ